MLRLYVDRMLESSYSEMQVFGEENIPTDGAVIIAPNHCNTLMDPLVVLRSRKEPTVFGARADIFNNKTAAKALKFLRILPMVRKRDGLRNVTKNLDSFEQIVETLESGMMYCMFCEGTHRPKHSLLPVNKGIVRIALAANERFGDKKPVYILPAGIEYGDYFRFKSTALLQYGKPINVTEYVKAHPDALEADIYRDIMWKIADEISSLITFIPDNELYSAKWTLTRIWAGHKGSLKKKLENNRIAAAKAENADEALIAAAEEFEAERKKAHISIKSFGKEKPILNLISKTTLGIILLPVFIYSTLMALPIWLTSKVLCSKMKDPAFRNTVRFGVHLALLPFMCIIWGVLLFIFLPWPYALILFLIATKANGFYYRILEYYRVLLSDVRLLGMKKLTKKYWDIKNK